MDQPLKQRLIGVTIVVALAVIFIPMLFEKSDDKGKLGSTGIPSIPEDVLEKTIELPKTAEELAPKEEENVPIESGYRIVPLNNEEPPPPAKPANRSSAQPKHIAEGDDVKPIAEEEDSPKPVKPGRNLEKKVIPDETAKMVPVKAPDSETPKKKHHFKHPSQPKHEEPANDHPDDLKRAEAAKPPVHHHPKAKVSKPRPYTPPQNDRDLDEEPVPVPVQPETSHAKPKASAEAGQHRGASAQVKPKTPKPSESEHPASKADRPKTTPPTIAAPHAKPKAAKPAESVRPAVKADKPEFTPSDPAPPQAKPKAAKPAESVRPAVKADKRESTPSNPAQPQAKPKAANKIAPTPTKPVKPTEPD